MLRKAKKFYAICLVSALIAGLSLFFCFNSIKPYTADSANIAVAADPTESMIYWGIDGSGTLYLDSDESSVAGYNPHGEFDASINYNASPWATYFLDVKKVTVNKIIKPTSTAYWFQNFSELASIENLTNIDTSNVTNMSHMFEGCAKISSLDLSNFHTSNVANMSYMFKGCAIQNLNFSSFDTSNVTDMSYMFSGFSAIRLDLKNLDTSKVMTMKYMFENVSSMLMNFNFNPSIVTDISYMFSGYSGTTPLNLSIFTLYTYTNAEGLLSGCSANTITLPKWSEDNTVTTIELPTKYWSAKSGKNLTVATYENSGDNLSKHDVHMISQFTSKPTRIEATCTLDGHIAYWKCDVCGKYFKDEACTDENEITLSETVLPKLGHDFAEEFTVDKEASCLEAGSKSKHCSRCALTSEITAIPALGHNYVGGQCETCGEYQPIYWGIISQNQLIISTNESDISSAAVGQSGSFASNFEEFSPANNVPWNSYNSSVTYIEVKGNVCPISTQHWFNSFSRATEIKLDGLDTSNVTNMSHMFMQCSQVQSLDLTKFNTENVTNMDRMFYGLNVDVLDISSFTVKSNASISQMISIVTFKTIKLPNRIEKSIALPGGTMFWDGSKLITGSVSSENEGDTLEWHYHYFLNGVCTTCKTAQPIYWGVTTENKLIISTNEASITSVCEGSAASFASDEVFEGSSLVPWNEYAATVTDVEIKSLIYPVSTAYWFNGFLNLENVNLNLLDTSNTTNMSYMFSGCEKLTALDVSKFNTDKCLNFNNMFSGCQSLKTLDLSSFALIREVNMSQMLALCSAIRTFVSPKSMEDGKLDLPGTFWDSIRSQDMRDITPLNIFDGGQTLVRHDSHDSVHFDGKAATCTEDGNIEYWQCSICKKYFNNAACGIGNVITLNRTVISKLGHDFAEDFTVDKAATCLLTGSMSKHCSRCDEKTEVTEIPVIAHTEVTDGAVAPTCTEKGKTEGKHCSVCNTVLVAQTDVAALGHAYGDWIVSEQATCTEKGSRYHVCANDSSHVEAEDIAALGHAYGDWTVIKEATKDENGEEQRVCANDPSHVDKRSIPKLTPAPEEPVDVTVLVIVIVVLSVVVLAEVIYLVCRKVRSDKRKKEDIQ